MAAPAISIRNLDHLGLVAALSQELGIARMIDAVLPKTPPFKVSHGEALVAMILNGLGFHSSTLHMFPQFFANKPVERLIGPGICADDLNDDVLGRCLDALFEANVSALYQVMAEQVVERLGLKSTAMHLDITSFHVDGAYDHVDGEPMGKLQLGVVRRKPRFFRLARKASVGAGCRKTVVSRHRPYQGKNKLRREWKTHEKHCRIRHVDVNISLVAGYRIS